MPNIKAMRVKSKIGKFDSKNKYKTFGCPQDILSKTLLDCALRFYSKKSYLSINFIEIPWILKTKDAPLKSSKRPT